MSEKNVKWAILILLALILWRRKSFNTIFVEAGAGLI